MRIRNLTRHLGLAVVAAFVVAACGSSSSNNSATCSESTAKTATTASACGGIDALVVAAKAEGKLNIIATPPDWANYGEAINGFQSKYGITITSDNPNGSSQDEINAVTQLGTSSRAPDVLDMGKAVTLANLQLYAPYKVATWADILDSQKDPTGLWWQDYGGYMSIGYDSTKVPTITTLTDLLKPEFKGKVALNGNAKQANAALQGVMMANLAQGGTPDNISKGVDFFHQLKQAGNFSPVQATSATVANGTTPVVFDWDYLSASHGKDVPTWKIFEQSNAILGDYYQQAINKNAPHPAAARLWEEYLYSDTGQNDWLRGKARPVRMAAMIKSGTIDKTAAAALPAVNGTPVFLTDAQASAAKDYLVAHWDAAMS
ncbi:MAG TPA: ABC transporter substrate-binding protein [Candidatus Sulfotelmatobacter sp.]|nr:ABC transporter substrate-binding protein [Candidatus Sulfotelmatobacter sp.]